MGYSIPAEMQMLLDRYVKLLRDGFGDAVTGVYIYGSLVTGCFVKNSSDIDFMTVIDKKLDEKDIKKLEEIHRILADTDDYGDMLEGEYVDCSDIDGGMPVKQYPYFAFGRFQGFVGINSFAWFQLKEKGVSYYGRDFNSIAGDIDWKVVRSELLERLSVYWPNMANWKLFLDKWLAMVVLSVCRVYFSLENKSTISKDGGGEFALSKLSEKWHPLINEALRIHKRSPEKSLYASKIKRARDAREFVKHISTKYST